MVEFVVLGLDPAVDDVVVLVTFQHHAAASRCFPVGSTDDRQHQREPLVEDHRRPAVPRQRLPVARTPGLVAQAETVHLPHLVTDFDRAGDACVLLVMGLGEGVLGVGLDLGPVGIHRLAAVHRRHASHVELHAALDHRIFAERLTRIGHLLRLVEHDNLPLVGDRQMLERGDHGDLEAAGMHGVVVLDLGSTEHETHPPVGQVQAHRHFGIALVDSIPEPKPRPQTLIEIKPVQVHRFVVVRRSVRLMGVLVLRLEDGDDLGSFSHGVTLPHQQCPALASAPVLPGVHGDVAEPG